MSSRQSSARLPPLGGNGCYAITLANANPIQALTAEPGMRQRNASKCPGHSLLGDHYLPGG